MRIGIPGKNQRALAHLAQPEGSFEELSALGITTGLPREWAECLEVRARYRGYIERQQRLAQQSARLEQMVVRDDLWDGTLAGVSREAAEKLRRWRPRTIAQAGRIAGVSPADVAVLLVLLRRAASQNTPEAIVSN